MDYLQQVSWGRAKRLSISGGRYCQNAPVWVHVPVRGVVYRLEARYQVCGLPDQSSLSAVPLASSSAVAGRTAATVQVKTSAMPASG